jgi:hypothetical protein
MLDREDGAPHGDLGGGGLDVKALLGPEGGHPAGDSATRQEELGHVGGGLDRSHLARHLDAGARGEHAAAGDLVDFMGDFAIDGGRGRHRPHGQVDHRPQGAQPDDRTRRGRRQRPHRPPHPRGAHPRCFDALPNGGLAVGGQGVWLRLHGRQEAPNGIGLIVLGAHAPSSS